VTATKATPKRPGRPILSTYVDRETKAEVRAVAAERNTTVSALLRDGLTLVLVGTAGGEDAVAVLNDNHKKGGEGDDP
jgi:hypothetical protein